MLPLLRPGDVVLLRAEPAGGCAPRHGDIVVACPERLGGAPLIKRVAALPREPVMISDQARTLGHDEYLLLGDNASDSLDSRTVGPVRQRELLGRVWLRLWPALRVL